MFVSLAVWLLSKLGKNLKQPQEYDDPNSIVNNILESSVELVCCVYKYFDKKEIYNFLLFLGIIF